MIKSVVFYDGIIDDLIIDNYLDIFKLFQSCDIDLKGTRIVDAKWGYTENKNRIDTICKLYNKKEDTNKISIITNSLTMLQDENLKDAVDIENYYLLWQDNEKKFKMKAFKDLTKVNLRKVSNIENLYIRGEFDIEK